MSEMMINQTIENTENIDQKALELAQASEVVDGKPGKLDATVAQNGKNFSGGENFCGDGQPCLLQETGSERGDHHGSRVSAERKGCLGADPDQGRKRKICGNERCISEIKNTGT